MKLINKIVCFFSVLILCVPMFLISADAYSEAVDKFEVGTLYPDKSKVETFDFTNLPVFHVDRNEFIKELFPNEDIISEDDYDNGINGKDPIEPYEMDIKIGNFYHRINVRDTENAYLLAGLYSAYQFYCEDKNHFNEGDKIYYYCYLDSDIDYGVNSTEQKADMRVYFSKSFIYFNTIDETTFIPYSENPIYCSRVVVSRKHNSRWARYYTDYSQEDYTNIDKDTYSSYDDENKCYWYYKDTAKTYLDCACFDYFMTRSDRTRNFYPDNLYIPFPTENLNFLPNAKKDGVISAKAVKGLIDFQITPDFSLGMDNDSFSFTITNNSDTPVQYVMYIMDCESGGFREYYYYGEDNADNQHLKKYEYLNNVYDYRIYDCIANFEFELDQCKWLYLTDEYYYTFESELDEIIGFNQDYNLSLSKQYGSSYWHYLGIGSTYSDKIYLKNIALAQNKTYYFRVRAISLDPSFECSSILFDPEWMSGDGKSSYFEWHMNQNDFVSNALALKNHWWTLSADFHLTDSLRNIYLNSKNVSFLYNEQFSFSKIPAFDPTIPDDSNYNKSSGFTNDKNNVYDPVYKNNLDTGKEEFLNGNADFSNLSDVNVDLDNVGIDDVKSYISTCTSFFALIKSVLVSFPAFIWVLVCFGLTAIIVIAIVRYIRG